MPRHEDVEVELRHPVEDLPPRLRVPVAHPDVVADEDEVGGEEDARVGEVQERVALGVPAAVGDELGATEAPSVVEDLVGQALLDLRDGGHELRRRVLGRLELLAETREPLLVAGRDQLARPPRGDDRRALEDLVAAHVVAVPVAVHDPPRTAGRRREELTRRRRRPGGVEDERLTAQVDDPRVSHREVGVGDRRPRALRRLLEAEVRQAVRRAAAARASSSRRRMRGFASFTISSR